MVILITTRSGKILWQNERKIPRIGTTGLERCHRERKKNMGRNRGRGIVGRQIDGDAWLSGNSHEVEEEIFCDIQNLCGDIHKDLPF
jgi:hypothetical protein